MCLNFRYSSVQTRPQTDWNSFGTPTRSNDTTHESLRKPSKRMQERSMADLPCPACLPANSASPEHAAALAPSRAPRQATATPHRSRQRRPRERAWHPERPARTAHHRSAWRARVGAPAPPLRRQISCRRRRLDVRPLAAAARPLSAIIASRHRQAPLR